MFEAGKKYKKGSGIFECLSVHLFRKSEVAGVMKYAGDPAFIDPEDKGDIPSVAKWTNEWTEYHESVVVKGARYVMSDDSSVWTQGILPPCEKSYLAGQVEFTVTDGKLTDVKIL